MNQIDFNTVNTGFGRMADEYDAIQETNLPVKIMREKYYEVVLNTVPPPASLLELNCGSGIDAVHFSKLGYKIFATDISDKMLQNAESKNFFNPYSKNLTFKKMNLLDAGTFDENSFDAVLSNLGGINCIDNPVKISKTLSKIIKPGGYFIASVMPRFSFWEFFLLIKGEFKRAFRRFNRNGIIANVGGEKVFVKYYSPKKFHSFFKNDFNLISTKALRIFAPPPPAFNWYNKFPHLTYLLDRIDNSAENFFPFAFACDFYVIVLQRKS